ncbi:MAG: HlyD family efflux transporter periplasmic adaptor subunit [Ahrensia sp.]|nr:HlyD family efflux transporter periplasmic adaptor subunit [Ahrensia sp.]
MLSLAADARNAESEAELGYQMVNATRSVIPFRQAILLLRSGPRAYRAISVSSLSAIDRNAIFIRWVEAIVAQHAEDVGTDRPGSFDARRVSVAGDLDASSYPFAHMAFVPLKLRDETPFGCMLFASENTWSSANLATAAKVCDIYAHAWEALSGPAKLRRKSRSKRLYSSIVAALLVSATFMPVPLSALGTAEVTPSDAALVSAPMDGTIEALAVDPNTQVKAGDLLFSYDDTQLRNRLQLAGQAIAVAQARHQQSLRTSFTDESAKRDLAIAQSELALKALEYDYAKDLLDRAQVRASSDGLVIFSDKESWTGRPVTIGERIMRVADPTRVELSIDMPVADAIVLREGAPVQLYLDSDPLRSIPAKLTRFAFNARPDATDVLSYRVTATFEDGQSLPRIGLRGTAKISGDHVALGYYLFRKPISTVRQWIGY